MVTLSLGLLVTGALAEIRQCIFLGVALLAALPHLGLAA